MQAAFPLCPQVRSGHAHRQRGRGFRAGRVRDGGLRDRLGVAPGLARRSHRRSIVHSGDRDVRRLLLAKTLSLIPSVEPCIRELLGAGKYIDPATYRDILLKAGEL